MKKIDKNILILSEVTRLHNDNIYDMILFISDVDLELESNDEGSKNDKDTNTNDNEVQRPRKGSRRISILSAEIDGKKAVSFLGALRIPVISNICFNLDLSLNFVTSLISFKCNYILI